MPPGFRDWYDGGEYWVRFDDDWAMTPAHDATFRGRWPDIFGKRMRYASGFCISIGWHWYFQRATFLLTIYFIAAGLNTISATPPRKLRYPHSFHFPASRSSLPYHCRAHWPTFRLMRNDGHWLTAIIESYFSFRPVMLPPVKHFSNKHYHAVHTVPSPPH